MNVNKNVGFIFKTGFAVLGYGIEMEACFPCLGVHVTFIVGCNSEQECINEIREPAFCPNSTRATCRNIEGRLVDCSQVKDLPSGQCSKLPVLEKALAFIEKE